MNNLNNKKLSGIFTALITPFKRGKIDQDSFSKLVIRQLQSGINGLVPCGSTGEFATLEEQEVETLTKICVELSAGKAKVVANASSNNTNKAIKLANDAEKWGVDAVLSVVPYYNKPSQQGIYEHFKEIHDNSELPIIIYNVPGRTVADMSVETALKLAELPRIIAIKDATSDLERPLKMRRALKRDDFAQFSGEDYTFMAFNASGGDGCISIASNLVPNEMMKIQNFCDNTQYHEALGTNLDLLPLFDILFVEANPVPIKYAMSLLGLCSDEVRLPLTTLSTANKEKVKQALIKMNII